jgi:hypothetical protein
MRSMLWVAGIALLVSGNQPAAAHYYCENGQMPAPPEIAAQMALPLCGFAATKRWGPNGCQLCDARNMYPNPFSYQVPHRDRGARHDRGNHGYE